MEASEAISIHGDESAGNGGFLGRGAGGTVKVYNSPRKGKVARKMLVSYICYEREMCFLKMCTDRESEPLSKFVIGCIGGFHKGDNIFIIDFELAESDLHKVAVNCNDTPTGCKQFFPDGDSFDRAITDTLSGLIFLHEHVNIYHNDMKPANLLLVKPQNGPQIVKIGDLGLCTEMETSCRSFGTLGYSAPEVYDSKRFHGDPPGSTYAVLGKSDVFGLGLSLIFVTEGQRPYPIPRMFRDSFARFCRVARGPIREKLEQSMCIVASDFYHSKFSPKIPSCKNITNVSFASRHVIACMCESDMSKRPTARECFNLFYKLSLLEHPSEPPRFENVSVQAVTSPRANVSSIRSESSHGHPRVSNFDHAIDKGLGDFEIISAGDNAAAAPLQASVQEMDVLVMERERPPSYSNASFSPQSAPPNANVEHQPNANQDACTKPKHPEDVPILFKVPSIPPKRRAASVFVDYAKRFSSGNNAGCYSNTNSYGSTMAHRWSANANFIPQHAANANLIPQHAANANQNAEPGARLNSIAVDKSLEEVITYLREKAGLVLGGNVNADANANAVRIPISNSVDDANSGAPADISYSYSQNLAPVPHANANNANLNASLLSGIDQITFHDQPVEGLNYDAVIENEMAALVVNPNDVETQLMNELLHDAVGKKEENFRDYLVNNNASAEKVALLDKLRHRSGRSAPISECALKLLRLLHEPNHPLIDQRKRLFMTITGYKKNWWKKCRRDHVQVTEEPDN
jgi:serine/threonine protein kinase